MRKFKLERYAIVEIMAKPIVESESQQGNEDSV
jgi:hypothetical protein